MLFNVRKKGAVIEIVKKSSAPLYNVVISVNNQVIGYMLTIKKISFTLPTNQYLYITIESDIPYRGSYLRNREIHPLYTSINTSIREPNDVVRNYKPGDILVGCDNVNGLPYGYMGHAAIAIDENYAIESTPMHPIVRKIPISEFNSYHPIHVQIRPRSAEMGKRAAQYAINYLNKFTNNYKNGVYKPTFYFTLESSLADAETYIYCSKLVWLSYYYGAGFEIENDHLWFAPEDLYSQLKDHSYFEIVYIHPDFHFKVDL